MLLAETDHQGKTVYQKLINRKESLKCRVIYFGTCSSPGLEASLPCFLQCHSSTTCLPGTGKQEPPIATSSTVPSIPDKAGGSMCTSSTDCKRMKTMTIGRLALSGRWGQEKTLVACRPVELAWAAHLQQGRWNPKGTVTKLPTTFRDYLCLQKWKSNTFLKVA